MLGRSHVLAQLAQGTHVTIREAATAAYEQVGLTRARLVAVCLPGYCLSCPSVDHCHSLHSLSLLLPCSHSPPSTRTWCGQPCGEACTCCPRGSTSCSRWGARRSWPAPKEASRLTYALRTPFTAMCALVACCLLNLGCDASMAGPYTCVPRSQLSHACMRTLADRGDRGEREGACHGVPAAQQGVEHAVGQA